MAMVRWTSSSRRSTNVGIQAAFRGRKADNPGVQVRVLIAGAVAGLCLGGVGLHYRSTDRASASSPVVTDYDRECLNESSYAPAKEQVVYAAARAVTKALRKQPDAHDHFTQLALCTPRRSLVVWRVPGAPALDDAIRSVTARHDVGLMLLDTAHSDAELRAVGNQIVRTVSAGEMARLQAVEYHPEDGGFVQVWAYGDTEAVRRALRDHPGLVRVARMTDPPCRVHFMPCPTDRLPSPTY
jgi:hypothetical protein